MRGIRPLRTLYFGILPIAPGVFLHCGSTGGASTGNADSAVEGGGESDALASSDTTGQTSSPGESGSEADDADGGNGNASDAVSSDDAGTPDANARADGGPSADATAGRDTAGMVAPADAAREAASGCGALPVGGLYVTFQGSASAGASAEAFHAWIDNQPGIDGALALWHGTTPLATIPDGVLLCQRPAPWNCPWHWQIDPASIAFVELATEVCDGKPSYVEANCSTFGGGRYCPWSVKMVELRDCRTDPSCPVVAK